MATEIRLVDFSDPQDGAILVSLLDHYACDPMGGGEHLSEYTRTNLITNLQKVPGAFSILAFIDGQPAGLINCFEGFSTFKCKPVINVHDVVVHSDFRGQGLSLAMMEKVESESRARGAAKMTLEVLEGNEVAKKAYQKFGFAGYELDPKMGKAMFWEKPLK